MGFKITSDTQNETFTGQIITYKIGILPGIKTNWITEITHIKKNEYFVDEQRFGPYKMWHHIHSFEENEQGVLMTDKVYYKIPFGFIGHLAHFIFIKKQLKQIFTYRYQIMDKHFS